MVEGGANMLDKSPGRGQVGKEPRRLQLSMVSRQLSGSTTPDPRDERIFFAILSVTEPMV